MNALVLRSDFPALEEVTYLNMRVSLRALRSCCQLTSEQQRVGGRDEPSARLGIVPTARCLSARSGPGGKRFDPIDDLLEAKGVEEVERVLSARQLGVDNRIQRDRPQLLDESSGVFHKHDRVPIALRHEERRRIRSDVGPGG
jgi:hypothetical protein